MLQGDSSLFPEVDEIGQDVYIEQALLLGGDSVIGTVLSTTGHGKIDIDDEAIGTEVSSTGQGKMDIGEETIEQGVAYFHSKEYVGVAASLPVDSCELDIRDGEIVSRGSLLQYIPLSLDVHLKPKMQLPQGIAKDEEFW